MLNFIRALPMTAQELTEEYFESEVVKAAVASRRYSQFYAWTDGRGTGYTLIHNWMNRGGLAHVNVGKSRRNHDCFGQRCEILWRRDQIRSRSTKYQCRKSSGEEASCSRVAKKFRKH